MSVMVRLQEMQSGADNMPAMCPDLFEQLLLMTDLAVHPPKLNKMESKTSASGRTTQVKYWCRTCDINPLKPNSSNYYTLTYRPNYHF